MRLSRGTHRAEWNSPRVVGSNVAIGLVLLALFLLGFEFAIVSLLPLAATPSPNRPLASGFRDRGGTLGRAVMSLAATATYDVHGIGVPALLGSGCAVCVIVSLAAYRRRVSPGSRW